MYDSAGQYHPFYDMCGYCSMTTGGQHEFWCPCYQPPVKTKEQLLAEIREQSHIELDFAWQYLADH